MSTQSWRTYGGTNHFENASNATFNHLVVGNLTLKNQYQGFLDINGSLNVDGNAVVSGDVIINGNDTVNGLFQANSYAVFMNNVQCNQSLAVANSIVVNGSISVGTNLVLQEDLIVNGNIYVAKNVLAMGFNTSSNTQVDNPVYSGALVCNSYHQGSFMGINYPYWNAVLPGATLDIYSDASFNTATTTAINVFSTGTRTQSILSSNQNRQGVVLYTDLSQCSLHFFSDTSLKYGTRICEKNSTQSYLQYPLMTDVSANAGDAQLIYQRGGEMTFSVGKNMSIPSYLSVGTNAIADNSSYPVLLSDNGMGHTTLQESLVVYSDLSFAFFPDYYTSDMNADPEYAAQSALTMVAGNTTHCHTGLSMITRDGLGMRSTGGSYIYDSERAAATSGLTLDASGTWVPAQTVVQNLSAQRTNAAFCRSVTAFNTYSPPLDAYTMVINGPTHISNSEITLVEDVSFEIKRVVASPREYNAVIAFGSAQSFNMNTGIFQFPVMTSLDSGQNWVLNDVSVNSADLSIRNYNYMKAGAVYDSVSAMMALNYGGNVYVSSDGLNTWNPMILQYANHLGFANGVEAMSILDVDRSGNLIVMVDISYGQSFALNGYNLGYTFLSSAQSFSRTTTLGPDELFYRNFQNNTWFPYTHFPTNMNVVHTMDGFDTSYVFIAGTGITKYAVRYNYIAPTPVKTWNLNGPYVYRAMKTYKTYLTDVVGAHLNPVDPGVSVFVGDGIITWTSNGGQTFTDMSSNFHGLYFKDVTIYDTTHAVVVGTDGLGQGVMLATYNGGSTWTTPYSALNGSGMAGLLLMPDVSRNLVSFTPSLPDSYLVARVDANYHLVGSGGGFGQSRLYYCHSPMLFNRSAVVLDVCGAIYASGSLTVGANMNVGGVITCPVTTIQSDYRLKTDVVDLTDVASYSGVDRLRPVQYVNTVTGLPDIGFLAHEVAEVYPFLVHGDKDASDTFQSLNYMGLIGVLVKEIQELKRKIDEKQTAE